MSLSQGISKFATKATIQASDNNNKIFKELAQLTVFFSPSPARHAPYALGLLVNQYYFSVGTPSNLVGTSTSPNGADSLNRLDTFLKTNPWLGKNSTVYISNNTEEAYYADVLGWEAGKGTNGWVWAGATPYFMRSQAITHVKTNYS